MREIPGGHDPAAPDLAALKRDIEEHVRLVEAVRARIVDASLTAARLALPSGEHGSREVWQGVASVAFAFAAGTLGKQLALIDHDLGDAVRYGHAAVYEVASGA